MTLNLFDTKFCISINERSSKRIKYGENPFDRRAKVVSVHAYAFYEDVTIDELNYSYTSNYSCYALYATEDFYNLYKSEGCFSSDMMGGIDFSGEDVIVYGKDSKTVLLKIRTTKMIPEKIPQSGAVEILNSIAMIYGS